MKKVLLLILTLIILSSVAVASRNAMVPPSMPGVSNSGSSSSSSGIWAGLTDWFTEWFVADGNSLSINETTLGNFVDARMIASSGTSVWNKTSTETYYDQGNVKVNNTLEIGSGAKIYYSGGELVIED